MHLFSAHTERLRDLILAHHDTQFFEERPRSSFIMRSSDLLTRLGDSDWYSKVYANTPCTSAAPCSLSPVNLLQVQQ